MTAQAITHYAAQADHVRDLAELRRLQKVSAKMLEALKDCEKHMIISTRADMARLDRVRGAIAVALAASKGKS